MVPNLVKRKRKPDSVLGYTVNVPVCNCDGACFSPCSCIYGRSSGDVETYVTLRSYEMAGFNSGMDHSTLHDS